MATKKKARVVPPCTTSDSCDACTEVATHDDGTFVRTALVLEASGKCGSVDLVLPDGTRLAQLNIFAANGGGHLMVDVIDVDHRFKARKAMVFAPSVPRQEIALPPDGKVVGVDFKN